MTEERNDGQRAHFLRVKPNGTVDVDHPVYVQYNPTEFTLNKGAQIAEINIPGLDAPILQFVRGQTETLNVELFFDTTDHGMDDGAVSVTTKTDEFYRLIKIDSDTHAPPILIFSWGPEFPGRRPSARVPIPTEPDNQHRYGFKCIVESVQQRYTLFSSKGVPLRAVLTVALKEYKTLTDQLAELGLKSGDHTQTHVVEQGETLSQIATEVYDDPAEWRRVALANQIVDPQALVPGTVLSIPTLDEQVDPDETR
jgi:hypothetical protein